MKAMIRFHLTREKHWSTS